MPSASSPIDVEETAEYDEREQESDPDRQARQSAVDDESSVVAARYNTSTGTFEPLDSTVDAENDTVTATVEHFSKFTALDQDEWKNDTSRIVPDGVANGTDAQVVAYLKQNHNNAYGTLTLHDASLDESISTLDGGDGVDSYGNGIPQAGSTNHPNGCGDDEVHRLNDTTLDFNLETCGADDAFTLNYNVVGENPQVELDYRQTNIGLVIGGNVYPDDVTLNLSADGVDVTDSDGDGIVDSIENGTIPLGNGLTTNTDPHDADTDGDNLSDGTELLLAQKNQAGYQAASDPNDSDTDDDGLSDYYEVAVFEELEPWDADYDDDGIPDGEDAQPTVPRGEDGEQSFHLSDGEPTEEFLEGAFYGDWGYTNDRAGSRTAAYLFGWMFPFFATAAVTAPVIEDVVEIALEVRDCVAWNDAWWENALDCGFAAYEIGSTGVQIVGAVASVTVVGGALAAATFAADEAQDVGRAITVAVTVLNRAPVSSAQPVGRMIGKQFGGFATDVSRQIADQLPASKGDALLTGIRQAKLEEAGLSKGVASQVARNVDDLDTATDVVNRLDDLSAVSPGARGTMLSRVARHDDALRLAEDLNAEPLAKIAHTGKLDETARLLRSSDDAASLLNGMDPSAVETMFDLGFDQASRMRRTMVGYADQTDEFAPAMANQFVNDVARIDDAGVAGLKGDDGVVATDFIPSDESFDAARFGTGQWRNAKGSVWELRVTSGLLDNGYAVERIGREIPTISTSQLEDAGRLDTLVDEVPFPNAETRQAKVDIIQRESYRVRRFLAPIPNSMPSRVADCTSRRSTSQTVPSNSAIFVASTFGTGRCRSSASSTTARWFSVSARRRRQSTRRSGPSSTT